MTFKKNNYNILNIEKLAEDYYSQSNNIFKQADNPGKYPEYFRKMQETTKSSPEELKMQLEILLIAGTFIPEGSLPCGAGLAALHIQEKKYDMLIFDAFAMVGPLGEIAGKLKYLAEAPEALSFFNKVGSISEKIFNLIHQRNFYIINVFKEIEESCKLMRQYKKIIIKSLCWILKTGFSFANDILIAMGAKKLVWEIRKVLFEKLMTLNFKFQIMLQDLPPQYRVPYGIPVQELLEEFDAEMPTLLLDLEKIENNPADQKQQQQK